MQKATVNAWLKSFLATIDTAFLATADAEGQPYIQHRGGPKGFIRVVDEQTLAFIDVSGNRQYLSRDNLSQNDKICLFLIDFAHRRRVKVWGTATMRDIGNDQRICQITVARWDINCPKHINPQGVIEAEAGACDHEP
jgi:uncharacterized protein